MSQKQRKNLGLIIAVIIVIVIPAGYALVSRIMVPDVVEVKAKMENALLEKYGEDFVVEQIGTRDYEGTTEYVARIYPESIEGTSKEYDSYYYGSASVDQLLFGRLGEVGDSYGLTKINIGAEDYLMSEAKKIFGKRVLMKTDVKYKKSQADGFYVWHKEPDFIKALKDVKENPDTSRIELELYIYIFDRIDNNHEKEERRKQMFDFVQYLKNEGLFRYLEMGVIFIDERVLAPSYREYRREIVLSGRVEEVVEGEKVSLPPMDLRKEMSEVLQGEVDKMREEDILERMRETSKSQLSYEGIRKENSQFQERIYSPGMLKIKYNSSYRKYKNNNKLEYYYYNNFSNIEVVNNLEYIFLD